MNKIIRSAVCITLMVLSVVTNAQTAEAPTDVMHSNGKIYVVVAVVVTILSGLFIYLFSLDRKITKIEKATNPDREMRL